jgi:hypothetical protein
MPSDTIDRYMKGHTTKVVRIPLAAYTIARLYAEEHGIHMQEAMGRLIALAVCRTDDLRRLATKDMKNTPAKDS